MRWAECSSKVSPGGPKLEKIPTAWPGPEPCKMKVAKTIITSLACLEGVIAFPLSHKVYSFIWFSGEVFLFFLFLRDRFTPPSDKPVPPPRSLLPAIPPPVRGQGRKGRNGQGEGAGGAGVGPGYSFLPEKKYTSALLPGEEIPVYGKWRPKVAHEQRQAPEKGRRRRKMRRILKIMLMGSITLVGGVLLLIGFGNLVPWGLEIDDGPFK